MVGYRASTPRGTGGAGIAGVISGLQQAQQFNGNQQRMDESNKRMDMMQKQFDDSQYDAFNADKNDAILSWDEDDDMSGLERLKIKYPKLAGSMNFRNVDDSEIYDGDGKVTNGFINRYNGETDNTYDPDVPMKEQLKGLKLYSDDETPERFATPGLMKLGSNYGKFKREYDITQAGKLATIRAANAKANKDAGGAEGESSQDVLSRIEKITDRPLTKDEARQRAIAREDLKIGDQMQRSDIASGGGIMPTLEKFSGNNFGTLSDLEDASLFETAAINQSGEGGEKYAKYNNVSDQVSIMGNLYDLSKEFEGIGDDYDGGLVTTAVEEYTKMANSEQWKSMDLGERKQILRRIALRSKTGTATAGLLNAISGASVSEEEFTRTMDRLTAGDIDLNNPKAVAAALRGSADGLSSTIKGTIQGIRNRTSPLDKLNLSKQYLSRVTDGSYEPKMEPQEGEVKTPVQVAAAVGAEQVKKAADAAGDVITEIAGESKPGDRAWYDWTGMAQDKWGKGVPKKQTPTKYADLSDEAFALIDTKNMSEADKKEHRRESMFRSFGKK